MRARSITTTGCISEVDIQSVRSDFGYVIQSGGLFPHLTACQNASLPAVYRKWPRQKVVDRIKQLGELTQLPTDSLDRYPVQLSGGQRQRVSLMRALMLDPEILLMDEPLGALDPMIRSQLQVELRHIFRTLNKTVVMVTHDLNEAAYFGNQIILMRDGQIIQQGAIDALVNTPADPFVTEFIEAQTSHFEPGGERRHESILAVSADPGRVGNRAFFARETRRPESAPRNLPKMSLWVS